MLHSILSSICPFHEKKESKQNMDQSQRRCTSVYSGRGRTHGQREGLGPPHGHSAPRCHSSWPMAPALRNTRERAVCAVFIPQEGLERLSYMPPRVPRRSWGRQWSHRWRPTSGEEQRLSEAEMRGQRSQLSQEGEINQGRLLGGGGTI